MMLLDKGYFDYDFEKYEKPIVWEDTVKSDEEVSNLLAMFGMRPRKPETTEEIQNYIINQIKED